MTNIENAFTYHSPKPGQPERYTVLRNTAKALAILINIECPESYEKTNAIERLEECIMWANAAISRNE